MSRTSALRYIPNVITVVRILLTPLVLLCLTIPSLAGQFTATACFVVAGVSDYYDGVLARRMGARSRLGQFLDPLADKILVLGTFAALVFLEPHLVTWWGVALIALRDAVVTGVRSYAESQGRTLQTFTIAKWKTLAQLAFLFVVMVTRTLAHVDTWGGGARWLLSDSPILYAAFLGVVAFTVVTGLLYVFSPREDTV